VQYGTIFIAIFVVLVLLIGFLAYKGLMYQAELGVREDVYFEAREVVSIMGSYNLSPTYLGLCLNYPEITADEYWIDKQIDNQDRIRKGYCSVIAQGDFEQLDEDSQKYLTKQFYDHLSEKFDLIRSTKKDYIYGPIMLLDNDVIYSKKNETHPQSGQSIR